MPHQTEPSANNAMGNLLQAMLPRSQVRSEDTRYRRALGDTQVAGIDIGPTEVDLYSATVFEEVTA